MDPTVAAPGTRALIEQHFGFSLKDFDPAALRFVIDRSKEAGNAAFRKGTTQASCDIRKIARQDWALVMIRLMPAGRSLT